MLDENLSMTFRNIKNLKTNLEHQKVNSFEQSGRLLTLLTCSFSSKLHLHAVVIHASYNTQR